MITVVLRLLLIAGLIALMPLTLFASNDHNLSSPSMITAQHLGKMPMAFTENVGQWDEKVKFRANAGGATMWFSPDGAYYQFTRTIPKDDARLGPVDPIHFMADRIDREPKEYEIMMIKANFVGANPSPVMTGFEQMDYKCNYFIGNDPNEWHTDVPNYSAVVYSQLYDGIDLKYYGNGRQMEYDFIVEPGADFSQIKIEYEGAESVSINANGELVVETRWGEVVEQKPVIYQIDNNRHHSVEGIYRLQENNCFGFEVGDYNTDLPLVIDPVLTYSTYLGGSDRDAGWYISVDASGATYIAGSTQSTDFPTLDPFQGTLHHNDCFVTKLNVDGNSLVYSTYLGGSDGWEGPGGIAVDSSGAVYVGGTTSSTDFPTLNPYQGTHYGREGNWDCFVTKLADTGDSLIYSTYLGGGEDERNYGIAIDSSRKLPH